MELDILRKRMRTVRTSTLGLDDQKQPISPPNSMNGVSNPSAQQKDVPP